MFINFLYASVTCLFTLCISSSLTWKTSTCDVIDFVVLSTYCNYRLICDFFFSCYLNFLITILDRSYTGYLTPFKTFFLLFSELLDTLL